MNQESRQADIRAYFESGEDPWEKRYGNGSMEARMYADRQRAGLTMVKRYVSSGANVLEIGCGPGYLSEELQQCGYQVTACDLALRMVQETRSRAKNDSVLVANVLALPFRDAVFDSVILIGVISYVMDPDKVLQRIQRLLKPDGIMIVSSANTRLLLNAVSNKLNAPLYRLGAERPTPDKSRQFLSATCNYYRASEFNALVTRSGFRLVDKADIGFGQLRILRKSLLPVRANIALSRLVSKLSRMRFLRWLGDFAFANVACFRRAESTSNCSK